MRISDWSSDVCSSDLDAPGEAGEAHWNEEAKALIAGILLWVACDGQAQGEDRTLEAVRDCLTFAPDNFQKMLRELSASTQARGLIARVANRHLGKSDREAAGEIERATCRERVCQYV